MKLSVILPSYNVSTYIEECIQSVLGQAVCDMEIICVDAGSTDGTAEIIDRLAKEDARIKAIISDKKSYGYQVNLGISEACGEYIQIVETDDMLAPGACEKLIRKADETQADVVKGNYYLIKQYINGQCVTDVFEQFATNKYEYGRALNATECPMLYHLDSGIWRGIYRRSFILGNDIRLCETQGAAYQDIGFIVRVLMKAKRFVYIDDYVYYYRANRPGASSVNPNVLDFCMYEYQNLIDEAEHAKKRNMAHLKGILSRLADSFLGEVDRLTIFGFGVNQLAYEWFVSKFAAKYDGLTVYELIGNHPIKERLMLFVTDFELYKQKYTSSRNIFSMKYDTSIVLCGIGRYGQRVIDMLNCRGILPSLIADNDEKLIGKSFIGISIVKPLDAVSVYPDANYIVANRNHSEEIVRQLLELGIRKSQISVFC